MTQNTRSKKSKHTPYIYIVSDGTGDTANKTLNSALKQFRCEPPFIETCSEVRTQTKIRSIIKKVQKRKGIILYTLVETKMRTCIRNEAKQSNLHIVDLLGSSLRALHKVLHISPSNDPGIHNEIQEDRRKRMEAVDYTFNHDDGNNPKDLKDADVILVGLSRSSKSSTAFYLGFCGIRVANIPITIGIGLPKELDKVNKNKIVALTKNPHLLACARNVRAEQWEFEENSDYTNVREIGKETIYMSKLIDKFKWKSIDVSVSAIEEVASEVVHKIGKNMSDFTGLP